MALMVLDKASFSMFGVEGIGTVEFKGSLLSLGCLGSGKLELDFLNVLFFFTVGRLVLPTLHLIGFKVPLLAKSTTA